MNEILAEMGALLDDFEKVIDEIEGFNVQSAPPFQWPVLVSGSQDNTIKFWSLEDDGRLIMTIDYRTREVIVPGAGRELSESSSLTSAMLDDTFADMYLRRSFSTDEKRGKKALSRCQSADNSESRNCEILALKVLNNGFLVSASCDKTVKVWDPRNGNLVQTLYGHTDWVTTLAVLSDQLMASGSHDGTIKIWDLRSWKLVNTLKTEGWVQVLIGFEGEYLISGSTEGAIRIWHVNQAQEIFTLQDQADSVTALLVLPDGQIASGSSDFTIKIWSPIDQKCVRILGETQGRHWETVRSLVYLGDGRLASGSDDFTIKIWDIDEGRALNTLIGHRHYVRSMLVLSNGILVSGSSDSICLWDISDIERAHKIRELVGHKGNIQALTLMNAKIVLSMPPTPGEIK